MSERRLPGRRGALLSAALPLLVAACATTAPTPESAAVTAAAAAAAVAVSGNAAATDASAPPPAGNGSSGRSSNTTARAAAAAAAAAAANQQKPFAEVVKGAKEQAGLFNLYTKEDKIWLEIKPDQFDRPFFLHINRTRGIGQREPFVSPMLRSYIVEFHRLGNLVQM